MNKIEEFKFGERGLGLEFNVCCYLMWLKLVSLCAELWDEDRSYVLWIGSFFLFGERIYLVDILRVIYGISLGMKVMILLCTQMQVRVIFYVGIVKWLYSKMFDLVYCFNEFDFNLGVNWVYWMVDWLVYSGCLFHSVLACFYLILLGWLLGLVFWKKCNTYARKI